jgi:hypothetical protein
MNIEKKFNLLIGVFEDSKIYRHLLFLFATIVSICFIGYYFGTSDQVSHIPYLKKEIYPFLFPNDKYFDLRFTHYSYFWMIFKPFLLSGRLEITMFFTHIIATYITFWAVWNLSKTLFNNTLVSMLSVIAFIIPHIGFGGFPIIEFNLVNRTVVLPFLIIAVSLFLKKRYYLTFILLGILYNFHVLSVNFILGMFGF